MHADINITVYSLEGGLKEGHIPGFPGSSEGILVTKTAIVPSDNHREEPDREG